MVLPYLSEHFSGARCRDRTYDLVDVNDALYQLS